MKKFEIPIIILAVLMFASVLPASDVEERRCIFSVQTISVGGELRSVEPKGAGNTNVGNGIFLYETRGELIQSEHHSGTSREVINNGPEYSAKIRHAFKIANLPKLNFNLAVDEAIAKQRLSLGASVTTVRVYHGATIYKVTADFEGTSFEFECEHLGTDLQEYAKFSPELMRLQALLDCLEISF